MPFDPLQGCVVGMDNRAISAWKELETPTSAETAQNKPATVRRARDPAVLLREPQNS